MTKIRNGNPDRSRAGVQRGLDYRRRIEVLKTAGITKAGAAVATAPDPATQRAALGLGDAAISDSSDFAATSHTHAAGDITSGTMATARLGSGTANSTTFLRGDQTWASPGGGSLPAGVKGDILYHDGVDWVVLPGGGDDEFLSINTLTPFWTPLPAPTGLQHGEVMVRTLGS